MNSEPHAEFLQVVSMVNVEVVRPFVYPGTGFVSHKVVPKWVLRLAIVQGSWQSYESASEHPNLLPSARFRMVRRTPLNLSGSHARRLSSRA